jgi:hypothetical protein
MIKVPHGYRDGDLDLFLFRFFLFSFFLFGILIFLI